jgi:hypothetical protein
MVQKLFRVFSAVTLDLVLHYTLFLLLLLFFSGEKNSSGGWIGPLPDGLKFKLAFFIAILPAVLCGVPSGFFLSLTKSGYLTIFFIIVLLSLLSGILIAGVVSQLGSISDKSELIKFLLSFFVVPVAISFLCNTVTVILIKNLFDGNANSID